MFSEIRYGNFLMELIVVDDGTTSSAPTNFGDIFIFLGVCCVYLRGSNFGTTAIVKTRGRTGVYKDGCCASTARFAGIALHFD
jgi:hypothetical protein